MMCQYDVEQAMHDLDTASARPGTFFEDLRMADAKAWLHQVPGCGDWKRCDSQLCEAFARIEQAKRAIRGIVPICHQIDYVNNKLVTSLKQKRSATRRKKTKTNV
jgi:hypothetical protein